MTKTRGNSGRIPDFRSRGDKSDRLLAPRVEYGHFGRKGSDVSGDDSQAVMQRGGGEGTVHQGRLAPGTLVPGVERHPFRKDRKVHRKEASCGPSLEPPIPALDLVPTISRIEEMDALQHFAKRECAEVQIAVVIPQPRHHLGVGPLSGRLAEDIGIDEVGHGGSIDGEVALHVVGAFDFPIFHRAVEEDVGEGFFGLQPGVFLCGNDYRDRSPVPGDCLRPLDAHPVDQLAELVFRLLERPSRIHRESITRKSGLSSWKSAEGSGFGGLSLRGFFAHRAAAVDPLRVVDGGGMVVFVGDAMAEVAGLGSRECFDGGLE